MHAETLYGDAVARSTLKAWREDARAKKTRTRAARRVTRALVTLAQLSLIALPIIALTWWSLSILAGD